MKHHFTFSYEKISALKLGYETCTFLCFCFSYKNHMLHKYKRVGYVNDCLLAIDFAIVGPKAGWPSIYENDSNLFWLDINLWTKTHTHTNSSFDSVTNK